MRLIITRTAKKDLTEHISFIAKDNPSAAARILEQTNTRIQELKNNPRLGRPGVRNDTRELVITNTPFIVVYGIKEKVILVYHLYYTRQNWTEKEQ